MKSERFLEHTTCTNLVGFHEISSGITTIVNSIFSDSGVIGKLNSN